MLSDDENVPQIHKMLISLYKTLFGFDAYIAVDLLCIQRQIEILCKIHQSLKSFEESLR